MNYNISGIDMMILEVFAMFDTGKVEIKKEHQLLMVCETASFKKGKGMKGYFIKRKPVTALVKRPKVEPEPETKCFCNKGNSHRSRITLDTW